MKKALGIIGIIVVWAAIAAYIVVAGRYSRGQMKEIKVSGMRIAIADSSAARVISPEMVSRWISEGGFSPVGKPVEEVDTRAIEEFVAQRSEVRRVSVWTDLNGLLTVEVSQRRPVMRVRSNNGYRFWLTDDNCIIPDRGEFSAYVPVVTGNTPFPFGVTARGSYDAMLEANRNDFLGQFTAIDAERRSLIARRSSVQAEIRETRAKKARRFWSEARKDLFAEGKSKRIAELREQVAALNESLASVWAKEKALREKEKKSYQNYNFLTKLVNFVKSIENDDFWSAQIVQINVLGGGPGSVVDSWREPQIELVPRAGDHIVLLGELDGSESEKMDKLRLFYRNGLQYEGWDRYGYINIKYRGQIVCTK